MSNKNVKEVTLFKGQKIRRVIFNDEWWFSVIDVCGVLADSTNARDYWYRVKSRVEDEEKLQLSTICRQLKLEAADGKILILKL